MMLLTWKKKECTYGKFQNKSLLYAHAMSTIDFKKTNMKYYIEHWCESIVYWLSYSECEDPIPRVLPQLFKKRPRRAQMRHIKRIDANRNPYRCSHCNQQGYNKCSCPNPPIVLRVAPTPTNATTLHVARHRSECHMWLLISDMFITYRWLSCVGLFCFFLFVEPVVDLIK